MTNIVIAKSIRSGEILRKKMGDQATGGSTSFNNGVVTYIDPEGNTIIIDSHNLPNIFIAVDDSNPNHLTLYQKEFPHYYIEDHKGKKSLGGRENIPNFSLDTEGNKVPLNPDNNPLLWKDEDGKAVAITNEDKFAAVLGGELIKYEKPFMMNGYVREDGSINDDLITGINTSADIKKIDSQKLIITKNNGRPILKESADIPQWTQLAFSFNDQTSKALDKHAIETIQDIIIRSARLFEYTNKKGKEIQGKRAAFIYEYHDHDDANRVHVHLSYSNSSLENSDIDQLKANAMAVPDDLDKLFKGLIRKINTELYQQGLPLFDFARSDVHYRGKGRGMDEKVPLTANEQPKSGKIEAQATTDVTYLDYESGEIITEIREINKSSAQINEEKKRILLIAQIEALKTEIEESDRRVLIEAQNTALNDKINEQTILVREEKAKVERRNEIINEKDILLLQKAEEIINKSEQLIEKEKIIDSQMTSYAKFEEDFERIKTDLDDKNEIIKNTQQVMTELPEEYQNSEQFDLDDQVEILNKALLQASDKLITNDKTLLEQNEILHNIETALTNEGLEIHPKMLTKKAQEKIEYLGNTLIPNLINDLLVEKYNINREKNKVELLQEKEIALNTKVNELSLTLIDLRNDMVHIKEQSIDHAHQYTKEFQQQIMALNQLQVESNHVKSVLETKNSELQEHIRVMGFAIEGADKYKSNTMNTIENLKQTLTDKNHEINRLNSKIDQLTVNKKDEDH
jgi:hypothetical protein